MRGFGLRQSVHRAVSRAKGAWLNFADASRPRFHCPVCGYRGVFLDFAAETGLREFALCPSCGSLERHRLQWLVLKSLAKQRCFQRMRMLHFAPEPFFRDRLRPRFAQYTTADLDDRCVDFHADITSLPFTGGSFDIVLASHVLEHVRADGQAIAEVRRVLSSHGIAILPVPIVSSGFTIEYPAANPAEHGHVRFPGQDYYDRYKQFFSRVELHPSTDFPAEHQTFIYEDRSKWPLPRMPLRTPSHGGKHLDIVPVAYC